MANNYYTVVGDYTAGTRARGSEIATEFDSIATGFDSLGAVIDSDGTLGTSLIHTVPSSDGEYNGFVVSATVDTNATGVGAALRMASDGNFDEADADTAGTMPCRALALESGTGTKTVLLKGFLRVDSWNWTPGGDLYVSTTTGALTQTAPTADGEQVQLVGFAWDADTVYFSPGDYSVEGLPSG